MQACKQLYYSYRRGARRRGKEFNLSFETCQTLFTSNCTYCGYEGNRRTFRGRGWQFSARLNGIDRVDNRLGYQDGNVVACCKACNMMKGIMDVGQFNDWIDRLVLFRSKQPTKFALSVGDLPSN